MHESFNKIFDFFDRKNVQIFFCSNFFWARIFARRAYCVGTSLISLFVRRPSCPVRLSHSVLDRDFAKDACQELDSRSKPSPFGTFCKTSPYGRQSGCRTWPFLDHSRLSPDVIHHDSARHSMWEVFIVTQHIMTPHRLRKFERFLHNSPSGHPCPAGVI